MKKFVVFISLILFVNITVADGFLNYVNVLKKQAKTRGFSTNVIDSAFNNVTQLPTASYQNTHQTQILNTFSAYQAITVTSERVDLGKRNMWLYRTVLGNISQQYHVPKQYIVALWGLETNYGQVTGNFPEFSALTTLAYQSSRKHLFRDEIFAALTMLQYKQTPLERMQGSWAGAMGQCQFMPSAYLLFAVAYHHPGPADIWATLPDVFASTANYLQKEGWNDRYPLLFAVKLTQRIPMSWTGLNSQKPISVWLKRGIVEVNGKNLSNQQGTYSLLLPGGQTGPAYLVNWNNFRVIMRWNDSSFYAISVGELANKLIGN